MLLLIALHLFLVIRPRSQTCRTGCDCQQAAAPNRPRRWPMSAYMSTRHVKPPAAPLSSFLSSSPLSLVRPRRRLSLAPTAGCCRRRAQGVSRLARFSAGHRQGSAFTRPSTTAGLMGSVDCSCPLLLIRHRVSARYSDQANVLSVGLATKSMARATFASTYIRQLRSGLPRCCLHGRSCRRDGAHLSDGRLASADLRCGHTATHPTRPTHPTGGVGTQRNVDVIA